MALEDAAVFAALFSRLRREEQIGTFVSAYQEIRERRTVKVRRMDVSNAAMVRMPPGPERDSRDESIRHARGEWDDGVLQQEFEGVAALFCYEALDAADVSVRTSYSGQYAAYLYIYAGMVGKLGSFPGSFRRPRGGRLRFSVTGCYVSGEPNV